MAGIVVALDDDIFECARTAATARGMTVEAYLSELVRGALPPTEPAIKGHVSSVFGIVGGCEATATAADEDEPAREAKKSLK